MVYCLLQRDYVPTSGGTSISRFVTNPIRDSLRCKRQSWEPKDYAGRCFAFGDDTLSPITTASLLGNRHTTEQVVCYDHNSDDANNDLHLVFLNPLFHDINPPMVVRISI